MDHSDDHSGAKLATRLSFLAAGFAMACWAPLVPFAKERVMADNRELGLLLLCVGIGSVFTMPVTGWVSARWGAKPVVIVSGIVLALLVPGLAVASTAWSLAVVLLGFGAALGSLDVAMNVHAVEVERRAGVPIMSNFHGMFSVGGFAGSGGMTLLLSLGLSPTWGAVVAGVITCVAILLAAPRLLPARGEPMQLAIPHGIVVLLALLAGISFLVEGAMLDWGALFVIGQKLAHAEQAGTGYMLFSVAMTVGRLTGDRLVARAGNTLVLRGGGFLALAGFAVLLTAPVAGVALLGFTLIGLGASNIVPVLFRQAGQQKVMPVGLAVAALTTTGYAGVLAGPATVGFVAHAVGLPKAFLVLAALLALIPLCAKRVLTRS